LTFARHFTLPIVRQPSGKTFPNMSGTGGAADLRVKAAVCMMKAHPTLSLPQAMWMAEFSESECKNRTMQMRVRRAHSAQMPMVGTDIDVTGTQTMSSLSTQEGTMTKTSMIARWATIWEGGLKPPFFEVWTDVDEGKLEELKVMDIDVPDSAWAAQKIEKERGFHISQRDEQGRAGKNEEESR